MRKWSKQGFLNPASSNDDGWYKFSIRPGEIERVIGFNVQYIIADCGNKIYLEFDPINIYLDANGGLDTKTNKAFAKKAIKDANERIKKIRKFTEAVVESEAEITAALRDYIDQVQEALDKTDRK